MCPRQSSPKPLMQRGRRWAMQPNRGVHMFCIFICRTNVVALLLLFFFPHPKFFLWSPSLIFLIDDRKKSSGISFYFVVLKPLTALRLTTSPPPFLQQWQPPGVFLAQWPMASQKAPRRPETSQWWLLVQPSLIDSQLGCHAIANMTMKFFWNGMQLVSFVLEFEHSVNRMILSSRLVIGCCESFLSFFCLMVFTAVFMVFMVIMVLMVQIHMRLAGGRPRCWRCGPVQRFTGVHIQPSSNSLQVSNNDYVSLKTIRFFFGAQIGLIPWFFRSSHEFWYAFKVCEWVVKQFQVFLNKFLRFISLESHKSICIWDSLFYSFVVKGDYIIFVVYGDDIWFDYFWFDQSFSGRLDKEF